MTEQKEKEPKTTKMEGETEQQYTAWLLYCEYGSIDKLLKTWEGMDTKATEMLPELGAIVEKLGEAPNRTTIARWSKKYQWVKRTDLKLAEDLQAMREKSKKIAREKKHKILEAFERITNKIIKRLREGGEPTITEWKQVWEMAQVEMGLPTSRAALKFKQEPPSPEEKERHKIIDEILKPYATGKLPLPHSVDTERRDKKRKGKTN